MAASVLVHADTGMVARPPRVYVRAKKGNSVNGRAARLGEAMRTSPAWEGSCSARASPTAITAARNSGGPANRFIMITDICAPEGGDPQHPAG